MEEFHYVKKTGCNVPQAYKSGGERGFCRTHGGYPICQKTGCFTTQAYRTGGIKGFCRKHGGYPLCKQSECKTPQEYREGGERGLCRKHGGYPKCSKCNLWSVSKLGKLCSTCDPIKSEKIKKRQKTKENTLAKWLDSQNIKYEREVRIDFNCFDTEGGTKYAKIDFVIYTETCIIMLELDENQHKYGYFVTCENRRLSAILGTRAFNNNTDNMLVIRFNPDDFCIDGVKQKVLQKERTDRLKHMIFEYKQTKPVEIHYMYYDMNEKGETCLTNHTDYYKELKEAVILNKI